MITNAAQLNPVLADLAAASRILAARGVVDGFGHVSMRHPDRPDRFLLSRSLAPALVTPDDIVEYGLDGEAIETDASKGFLERYAPRAWTSPGGACFISQFPGKYCSCICYDDDNLEKAAQS